jgi:hypothetical protein
LGGVGVGVDGLCVVLAGVTVFAGQGSFGVVALEVAPVAGGKNKD